MLGIGSGYNEDPRYSLVFERGAGSRLIRISDERSLEPRKHRREFAGLIDKGRTPRAVVEKSYDRAAGLPSEE